jgi:hypothetical protein
MGAPDATMTMRRDHVEVGRLTAELGELHAQLDAGKEMPQLDLELRRVLYGLYALVSVHFAKEEEIYLPILDANLSADEAAKLFHDMETIASAASGHATH